MYMRSTGKKIGHLSTLHQIHNRSTMKNYCSAASHSPLSSLPPASRSLGRACPRWMHLVQLCPKRLCPSCSVGFGPLFISHPNYPQLCAWAYIAQACSPPSQPSRIRSTEHTDQSDMHTKFLARWMGEQPLTSLASTRCPFGASNTCAPADAQIG